MAPSALSKLPVEILQQILNYLAPMDFNNAGSSCYALERAGKDRVMLKKMYLRAGYWSAVCNKVEELTLNTGKEGYPSVEEFLRYWLFFEQALWPSSHTHLNFDLLGSDGAGKLREFRISHQKQGVDFTELGHCDAGASDSPHCGLLFNVSVCGYFVLVISGCMIYVYHMDGSEMQPVTLIICPKRVLATSMDTSAGKYAVVALLDGRVGVVCDLKHEINGFQESQHHDSSATSSVWSGTLHQTASLSTVSDLSQVGSTSSRSGLSLSEDESSNERVNSIHIRSPHQSVSIQNASRGSEHTSVNQTWRNHVQPFHNMNLARAHHNSSEMPLSSAPLSIYYSICSAEDPPSSVAISATRKCIAFGCAAGIEFHWTDGLSGRNLMKWFPLTAPSDHLFFIPARTGLDHPNKLRLISSKSGPGQRSAVARNFGRRVDRNYYGTTWAGLRRLQTSNQSFEYDHFNGVPINDGWHILFTDPVTGNLYLGSDAPAPNRTNISRKVRFVPPATIHVSSSRPTRLYTASNNLMWGVRVLACYADELILYCVPPDVLADLQIEAAAINRTSQEPAIVPAYGEWSNWHGFAESSEYQSQSQAVSSVLDQRLPITICGVSLGKVEDLVDVAIQEDPDLVVWAFASNGIAQTWTVTKSPCQTVLPRLVQRDGSIVDLIDKAGDVVMREDAWPTLVDVWRPPQEPTAGSMNGHQRSNAHTQDVYARYDGMIELDEDGDVIMTDAPASDEQKPRTSITAGDASTSNNQALTGQLPTEQGRSTDQASQRISFNAGWALLQSVEHAENHDFGTNSSIPSTEEAQQGQERASTTFRYHHRTVTEHMVRGCVREDAVHTNSTFESRMSCCYSTVLSHDAA